MKKLLTLLSIALLLSIHSSNFGMRERSDSAPAIVTKKEQSNKTQFPLFMLQGNVVTAWTPENSDSEGEDDRPAITDFSQTALNDPKHPLNDNTDDTCVDLTQLMKLIKEMNGQ